MRGVSVDVLDRSWPEIPWDDENQLTQRWPNAHIWIIPNVYVGTDGILFNKGMLTSRSTLTLLGS